PSSFPHMNSEWLRIGPEVIYWAPRLAAKIWNIDSIFISENGTSSEDKLTADGKVHDLDRVMYLRNYLTQLQRATSEGVPVRGYFRTRLAQPLFHAREQVRLVDLKRKPGKAGGRIVATAGAGALPDVETEVVMIAAGGEERSATAAARRVKSQCLAIKTFRPG